MIFAVILFSLLYVVAVLASADSSENVGARLIASMFLEAVVLAVVVPFIPTSFLDSPQQELRIFMLIAGTLGFSVGVTILVVSMVNKRQLMNGVDSKS